MLLSLCHLYLIRLTPGFRMGSRNSPLLSSLFLKIDHLSNRVQQKIPALYVSLGLLCPALSYKLASISSFFLFLVRSDDFYLQISSHKTFCSPWRFPVVLIYLSNSNRLSWFFIFEKMFFLTVSVHWYTWKQEQWMMSHVNGAASVF